MKQLKLFALVVIAAFLTLVNAQDSSDLFQVDEFDIEDANINYGKYLFYYSLVWYYYIKF
jgi:hypothetical protein